MKLLGSSLAGYAMLSLVGHGIAGASVYYVLQSDQPETVQVYASQVSLGMQAASRGSVSNVDKQAVTPVEREIKKVEEFKKPKKKPFAKPAKKLVAKKEEKEVKKPVKKIQAASPQQISAVSGALGVSGNLKTQQKQEQTGKNQQLGASSLQASYDADVLKHFSRYKRYPRRLKSRRMEAEVELVFEINRQGRVDFKEVVSNTGHRFFSASAIKQLRRAQPFPEIPEGLKWSSRRYRVSIDYSIDES